MSDETSLRTFASAEAKKSAFPVAAVLAAVSFAITAALLFGMLFGVAPAGTVGPGDLDEISLMDRFDMFMTNTISDALDGILAVEKVFRLSDRDLVAPEPDPACYGQVSSPAELMWLLDEAAELIGGQQMLFNENTPAWILDPVWYYYDETILVITWKEVREGSMFTISEVKIAHPSQFRRFLADGTYGSDKQYTTTEMAAGVNAVVASSGDFYKFRQMGTIVYNGALQRFDLGNVDTCFIDDKGDLLFVRRDELKTQEEARTFVQERNIRFSLAFGPVLVDEGEFCHTRSYCIGEIDEYYTRAALCQMDELHYLLVNSCGEDGYVAGQTINSFAKIIAGFGVRKAYALDGGQTTVIAMNDEMISNVDFGTQRKISDIIYFATAIPEGD